MYCSVFRFTSHFLFSSLAAMKLVIGRRVAVAMAVLLSSASTRKTIITMTRVHTDFSPWPASHKRPYSAPVTSISRRGESVNPFPTPRHPQSHAILSTTRCICHGREGKFSPLINLKPRSSRKSLTEHECTPWQVRVASQIRRSTESMLYLMMMLFKFVVNEVSQSVSQRPKFFTLDLSFMPS